MVTGVQALSNAQDFSKKILSSSMKLNKIGVLLLLIGAALALYYYSKNRGSGEESGEESKKKKCLVSNWSEWSHCDQECNGGHQTRTRTVTIKGDDCPDLMESRVCNTTPCDRDCEVSPWSEWGNCDKQCDGGKQLRTRKITQEPIGQGKQCPELLDSQDCNTQECYKDCQVGPWSEWSDCSKKCGGGSKHREREILQNTVGRGLACPETSQVTPCGNDVCDQDCEVSDWSAWSQCSTECGTGTQSRIRSIIKPQIANGRKCPPLLETQNCNTQECPGDCKVGPWSQWSDCSKPCGSGLAARSRNIITPATPGGFPCPSTEDHKQCNLEECPVDCEVSEWSNWSECSQPCGGGYHIRTRSVLQYPNSTGKSCPPLFESQDCNSQSCTPDDCMTSEWSPWSDCVKCGDEMKHHSRTIISQGSKNNCPPLSEVEPCDNTGCPVDCKVSDFSDWSECSAVCGGGQQHQDRFITQAPRNNGHECPPLRNERDCNSQACPIDCQLGEWSPFGKCNKDCGGGVSIRTREILVPPQNGGFPCGSTQDIQPCNTQNCPVDCEVSDWGGWSDCDKPCGTGQRTRDRHIIMEPHDGGKECPSLQDVGTCNEFNCPIDCQVSDWKSWSDCTRECGGGVHTRTRDVLVQPQYGGIGCPMTLDTQSCNEQECPVDCQVSSWGDWGACTGKCGTTSLQKRTRNIVQQPQFNGADCPSLEENRSCSTDACPTRIINNVIPRNIPMYIGYMQVEKKDPSGHWKPYCTDPRDTCVIPDIDSSSKLALGRCTDPGGCNSIGHAHVFAPRDPEINLRFYWSDEGFIYLKQDDGSKIYLTDSIITTTSDVNKAGVFDIRYIPDMMPIDVSISYITKADGSRGYTYDGGSQHRYVISNINTGKRLVYYGDSKFITEPDSNFSLSNEFLFIKEATF